MTPGPFHLPLLAAAGGEHTLAIFFTQVMLLIVVGRLLGEVMQRFGQPAVIGQLLAGIILGPSVFGTIWPAAQSALFPLKSVDRQMLSAVSELGVLMLLLVTGMETDLALVKRVRRAAAITSLAGIVFPFACGYVLGELLPDNLLPDPNRRLMTSLFLATALSISSVKIVATVLREADFLRRDLGQIILASAILDDTIGWTILAFIGGLAAQGRIVAGPILFTVVGTAGFLLFAFTIGRRWVGRIIRWANDSFVIEVPVISVILVLMIALALLTNFIGVHTVLGAFVAGILIGQSSILTKHIEEQLRGLIVALFMPVFFGVAGLSIDLKVLGDPRLLFLAVVLLGVATIGKLGGCYLGSRLSRMNHQEGLAVGLAMNARGSTEIILATIGLTIGVLNQQLFTLIVLMAVITTMLMPPMLRWALDRVPLRDEEKKRLETESAEEKDTLPKLERVLVGLDAGNGSDLAAKLAGWLIGARHLTASILDVSDKKTIGGTLSARSQSVREAAESAIQSRSAVDLEKTAQPDQNPVEAAAAAGGQKLPLKELISFLPFKEKSGDLPDPVADAILSEAKNGYGLLFLGLEQGGKGRSETLPATVEDIVRGCSVPTAIFYGGELGREIPDGPLERILVPTSGVDYSRFGAEVAVAIARGCGATVTALHVSAPPTDNELLRRPGQLLRSGRALLADLVALGQRESVRVISKSLVGPAKETAILRQARLGNYQLIVLGTKARVGEELPFGKSVSVILEKAPCPILIVKS